MAEPRTKNPEPRTRLIGAVVKAFKVEDWLAQNDLLAWRSVRETAAGAGVSESEAYRILQTMVACGRAEQSDKGSFRLARGIVKYGLQLNECLSGHVRRFV
jgi:DNA-binding IclR family transcriptional regulator